MQGRGCEPSAIPPDLPGCARFAVGPFGGNPGEAMTLLEKTARDAVADYRLADKRTAGDWIGAIKTVRAICGVDLRAAKRALLEAGARQTSWMREP